MSAARGSFTGRRRERSTRRAVKLTDSASRLFITMGGIGTILAVTMVFVFLFVVVVPLFLPAEIELGPTQQPPGTRAAPPLRVDVDEYLTLTWSFHADGAFRVFRLDTGEPIAEQRPFAAEPSAWSFTLDGRHLAVGFADGRVQLGRVETPTSFLEGDEARSYAELASGAKTVTASGVVEKLPDGRLRRFEVALSLAEPVELSPGVAVLAIDLSVLSAGEALCAWSADGGMRLRSVTRRVNLITEQETLRFSGGELDLSREAAAFGPPDHLLLAGLGDNVFLAWRDGRLLRLDTRDFTAAVRAEEIDLLPEPGAEIGVATFLIGKSSLLIGDSLGRTRVWFRIKPEGAATPDGAVLVMGREFAGGPAPVTALATSQRGRTAAVGYRNGELRLYHVTSERFLGETAVAAGGAAIAALSLAPKDDEILAVAGGELRRVRVGAPHPEISLAAIFTPVWYEGYPRPEQVWQSSSGTDDFEPKYGLMPLIFGSLKATVYSLLFAVPLAILAAIYTSEFLHPRAKARVKPTIELMASLPSVVLGFLAALVVAPFVEKVVPQALLALLAVPFAFVLGAHLWQCLPWRLGLRLARWRLPLMLSCVPAGLLLAARLGPWLERVMFHGDLKLWLDGQVGGGAPGWFLLLLPLGMISAAAAVARFSKAWFGAAAAGWTRRRAALFELAKFLAAAAAALALTWGVSLLLGGAGFDPRGGVFDTYVQRNALVVGFIMGFAVIPIIYTITEDALSAVPEHLRAASLGSGATKWQTAIRVVVPTAMSGIFSAVMVGFGRAVGETMIVLMAAGNTPLLEWNVFNGLRTLSANVAVELPEAVRDSTHYRMLFLAALVLFLITFVLNTCAEVVRARFRRRAYQL